MKLLLVIFVLFSGSAKSQNNVRSVKLLHYLLDSFASAKIRMKTGEVYNQNVNYNLITHEMIFEQSGTRLAMARPDQVDTVTVLDRRMVPVGAAFYEWLGGAEPSLFEEFTCIVKEPGTPTPFGSSSTTASVAMQSLINQGGAYGLKLPDEFEVIPQHYFYIRRKGQYMKFKNQSQLEKALPEKKQAIRDWSKEHKTDFGKREDLSALIVALQ